METFLGFPAADPHALDGARIAILGAPHGTPYVPGRVSHSADAPAAIRAASQKRAGQWDHHDFDLGGPLLGDPPCRVVDCGDVPGDPADPSGNRAAIAAAVRTVLEAGAVPVLLGGDDSVPIPFIGAYEAQGPLWVVQIDAHIDWREEREGERLGWSSTMRRASEMAWVEGIVQIGMRGQGTARAQEVADAEAYGARLVTAAEIHGSGVGAAIACVPEGADCLVTLDCDGLDPAVMPAVLAREPGGLSYWHAVELIQGLGRRANIAGFDIVELAPDRDQDGLGALTAARIVCNAIGVIARQR